MSNDDSDVEQASEKLANLSVCEEARSPLRELLPGEGKSDTPHSPQSHAGDAFLARKSSRTSGSESEQDRNQEDRIQFNKLVKKAKLLAQDGKVREALELNRQALKIHHHEKLARRIAKMEEYLKNYGDDEEEEEDDENDGMVAMGGGFYLYKDLYNKLYNHQKQGVLWMWNLHKRKKGGILGDDMGLGKTIQVIAFLSGMFDMEKIKHALIVVPVSVMVNWEKEFNKWAPGISVSAFHGSSKRERERSLERVRRRGGVLMTTYGMVVTSWEQLANHNDREFVWDYVILDEGHKIKNPTKTTKGIHAVGARQRLILTGTPIQNNLKELWTLFDYVHQGSLLGTLRTFKMELETPIIRARERDATLGEKRLGLEMAESLKKIIAPFFLRRTKAEVKSRENQAGDSGPHKSIKMPTMMYKNDFVVWLYLSDTQLNIYRDFLQLDSVKELLTSSKSPLVALTVLKKICDHPRLLSLRACHQLGLHGHEMDEDELELPSSYESAVTKVETLSDEVLVGEAGKMAVLVQLMDQLKEEGHRCLIFSQSRKMLDIIQKVLRNRGHKVMRLDGTVTSLADREERVQRFQKDHTFSVFLLTTQVGGVGLTLTAADRVVIYDPSWNPATDAQAVDRAFRIGQTRNVVVYRLITCGTVEEKIYRRQIFKDSITRQTTGGTKDPYRYFTRQELRELFQLDEPRHSTTQQQLEEMHGLDRRRDPELDTHIAFLHSLDIFGISDHDLMFSQETQPEEEFENPAMPHVDQHSHEYIRHRVQKAKEIIERESSVPGTMEQRFRSTMQYPPVSVYAAPENQALMRGVGLGNQSAVGQASGQARQVIVVGKGPDVPVFKPSQADSTRLQYNRLPGQPNTFRVEIQRPPQPVKIEVKPEIKVPPRSSDSSDVVDLTEDDDDDVAVERKPTSQPDSKGQRVEERKSAGDVKGVAKEEEVVEIAEEDMALPVIQKKTKQEPQRSPSPADDAAADLMNLSIRDDTTEDSAPDVPVKQEKLETEPPQTTASIIKGAGDIKQEKRSTDTPPSVSETGEEKMKIGSAEIDEAVFKSPPPPNQAGGQKRKPSSEGSKTPKSTPGQKTPKTPTQQRVIEEEIIISPNAYTPLMMTRKKRHRVTVSPGVTPERSLAFGVRDTPAGEEKKLGGNSTVLVEGSPDVPSPEKGLLNRPNSTSSSNWSNLAGSVSSGKSLSESQEPDELQSFLNEEDQSLIEESIIADDEVEGDGDVSPPLAGNLLDVSQSQDNDGDYKDSYDEAANSSAAAAVDDDEDIVRKRRRRSVCRRVAVVESSEEEEQDDEDKENLDPSFSSKDKDSGEMDKDVIAENQNNNADDEYGDDEITGDDEGAEEVEEEEMEDEVDEEDDGDEENQSRSVVVYEDEGGEEEEYCEEEADEEEESPVDMERIQQLLQDGKAYYKQKRYHEAKECLDAAIEMIDDPALLAMADKIQRKIDAGL